MKLSDNHLLLVGEQLAVEDWESIKDRTIEDLLCKVQDEWFEHFMAAGRNMTPKERWDAFAGIRDIDLITGNTRAVALMFQFYYGGLPDPVLQEEAVP